MWEHYSDLPFEVFCTEPNGTKHLISRHSLISEAMHAANKQNRSGGHPADWQDWRTVEGSNERR